MEKEHQDQPIRGTTRLQTYGQSRFISFWAHYDQINKTEGRDPINKTEGRNPINKTEGRLELFCNLRANRNLYVSQRHTVDGQTEATTFRNFAHQFTTFSARTQHRRRGNSARRFASETLTAKFARG